MRERARDLAAFGGALVLLVGATAFSGSCDAGDAVESEAVEKAQAGLTLLALDLEPLAAPLRTSEQLPTALEVRLDDVSVARVALAAPDGLLDGHFATAIDAGSEVSLRVDALLADGSQLRGVERMVSGQADQVVRVAVTLAADGESVETEAPSHHTLPAGTRLSVVFASAARRPVELAELGAERASAIMALLRDPQVAAVVPFTDAPSGADQVGPLVGAKASAAPVASDPATIAAPVHTAEAAVVEVGVPEVAAAPVVAEPPDTRPAAPIPASVRYYSYCTCAKPVAYADYTLTTTDGRVVQGRADRYGMVVLTRGDVASIDFGETQRRRDRAYAWAPGDASMHYQLMSSLVSDGANDVLTALLDLRDERLDEAYPALLDLLEHEELSLWLNAAVTLSYYDIDEVVADTLAQLAADSGDAEKLVMMLGAFRRPAAVPALLELLENSADRDLQARVAWALGFIASPEAAAALREAAIHSPSPITRDEAVHALGRIEGNPSLERREALAVQVR